MRKDERLTRYGETNTATLTGNEITVLFAISYRASPRWLIQRAGIWSVKSFDSLHGPAVTFAPHSSLTLARLAAGETTYTPSFPPPSLLLLISLRFTEPSTRFHPHPNIHMQLARISPSPSIFYRCEGKRKREKYPFNFSRSWNPKIKRSFQ